MSAQSSVGGNTMATDADREDEKTSKVWRDERWLQMNELNESSVLDYFALSDWYDNTCLTSYFNMQSKTFGGKMDKQYLKNMEGLDYEVSHRQSNRLFVIDKVRRQRDGRDQQMRQTRMVSYYVLDGWVYQCPPLHKLIDCKIQMMSHFVNKALEKASERHTFSVAGGHRVKDSATAKQDEATAAQPAHVYAFGATPQTRVVSDKLANGKMLEKIMLENLYIRMQKQQQAAQAQAQAQASGAAGAASKAAAAGQTLLSASPNPQQQLQQGVAGVLGASPTVGMKRGMETPPVAVAPAKKQR